MIVRELFGEVNEVNVIARAIYEDDFSCDERDGWIRKYYAHFVKLRDSRIRKSDMMIYLSVVTEGNRKYGDVSGVRFNDAKAGVEKYYAIENLNYRQYASLYVPDYTVQQYGAEVVASEILREYGWNGFDETIVCPENVRKQIRDVLKKRRQELFPADNNYYERCRKQFLAWHEGKAIPQFPADE